MTSLHNVARVPLFVYIEVSSPYFLYALGAVQVRSPIHTYAHLVRKPFASGLQTIRRTRVYEALQNNRLLNQLVY